MGLIQTLVVTAAHSGVYRVLLGFVAIYPVLTSLICTLTSVVFYARNERAPRIAGSSRQDDPMVSVLVAAYCEEDVVERSVQSLLAIDYPNKEIVIVDDGSSDNTARILLPYVRSGQIRLVRKTQNEGKAMALNDAIPLLRGEIVLLVDADIRVKPDILHHMVPHFRSGRVAAVTGNPQVSNTQSLLSKVQVAEFTSIVSVLRRGQRVWGRILTVSGAVTAFRKSAMVDVGLFNAKMATEDIPLSWELQRRFYDIRYEPRAVVEMQVPETLRGLWTQRRRWALGLAQVLRRHASMFKDIRTRRLWPVYIEACLSILWAYCATSMVGFWTLSYVARTSPLGASPFPNFWGMTIATLALVLLTTGILLERRYNRNVTRYMLWTAMYPMFYWILMTVITVLATLKGFIRHRGMTVRWQTSRRAKADIVPIEDVG